MTGRETRQQRRWESPAGTRLRRALVAFSLFGVVALGGVYLSRDSLLPLAAAWLDVGAQPSSVDAVMVLPGDENARPFVAAALIQAGLARKALIPHNLPGNEVQDGIFPPTNEIIRRVLVTRGVAAEQIEVLPGNSQSTNDDLSLLAEYLAVHPAVSIAVVTSAYHTRRTRLTLRSRLPKHVDRIEIVSAPNPDFTNAAWWRNEAGFRSITSEYVKLAAYWVLYGSGVYWMAGAGGTMLTAIILWKIGPSKALSVLPNGATRFARVAALARRAKP